MCVCIHVHICMYPDVCMCVECVCVHAYVSMCMCRCVHCLCVCGYFKHSVLSGTSRE